MSRGLNAKEKSKLTKEEWREYTKTVWQIANVSHPEHPAVFPLEIPTRLIKLFSFWGDRVLDPFAGVGTTAHAALTLGRKAVCIDQHPGYINVMKKMVTGHPRSGQMLTVVQADCRDMRFILDNSVGLIVTSPPYWNKADYGNQPSNIGSIPNYHQFLQEIKPAFAECLRVLQPGRKLCIVTAHVNQHTDHGLLTFPLATDFMVLLREMGFVMVNEIIWCKDGTGGKWGSYGQQRPIFGSYPYPPNFHFKNVHEYILICAKPADKRVKGPKVILYDELMSRTSASNGKPEYGGHTLASGNGTANGAKRTGKRNLRKSKP
jgi:DNA modification methylase